MLHSVANLRREFVACVALLLTCLLLGGSSQNGLLVTFLVQLASIPALVIALNGLMQADGGTIRRLRVPLVLAALLLLVPLIQLLPDPWTAGLVAVPATPGGIPMLAHPAFTVDPAATVRAALAMIPCITVFLLAVQLGSEERQRLVVTVLGVAGASVILGALQIFGGPSSVLRPYVFTNAEDAVGFFANRNHLAALLYSALVFAGAFLLDAMGATQPSAGSDPHSKRNWSSIVTVIAMGALMIGLLAGEVITRSRGGLILTVVGVFGLGLLTLTERGGSTRSILARAVTGALVLAGIGAALSVIASPQVAARLLESVSRDPLADSRIQFARNTYALAWSFLPFGSGLGTFTAVYPTVERTVELLPKTFINHAHNDFAEAWLETGYLGVGVMAVFVGWFLARAFKVLLFRPGGTVPVELRLERASVLVIGLLLAHAAVDYHLRTPAIAAVFALAIALLAGVPSPKRAAHAQSSRGRHTTRTLPENVVANPFQLPQSVTQVAAAASVPPPAAGIERWGTDIAWPDEWTKPSTVKPKPPTAG